MTGMLLQLKTLELTDKPSLLDLRCGDASTAVFARLSMT